MRSYEIARIDELRRDHGWSPIRRHLGIQAFGISGWSASEAGEPLVPEHDEVPSGHEELYAVVSGRATFTLDGDEVDAAAGTLVFVRDPAVNRGAVAAEADTAVLAIGARPGEAYRPRAWETNRHVLPLFEAGKYEEAKTVIQAALEECEDRGGLLFNLACSESRLGEVDAALEHLNAAIAAAPGLAENAREDSDLDPIRDDPRFPV